MTEILGQSRAMEMLDAALRSARFHHAWIFSGPRGVGKFTAAIEVARVLLDPESGGAFPIQNPKSTIQNLIDAGTHPDLHIIRKEMAAYSDERKLRERKQLNIPIDLLRERIIGGMVGDHYHDAPAYRTAQLGHGKVFIIDEAELLDEFGQNTMLKTLEEPPADTYFILVTRLPDRLLPTIRSRCQNVPFGSLDEQSMHQWWKQHQPMLKHDEGEAPNAAAIRWSLDFAEGSPGVATLALQYGFYNWQSTLDPMLAELDAGRFPTAMGDTLAKLVEEFAKSWVANHGTKTTSKDAANKDGARHLIALLATHARRQLAAHAHNHDHATRIIASIDLLHAAQQQLERNVNMKMLMENLVVQWWRASRSPDAVALTA